jgi:tetratricopeptide (TPR) repeat protein
VVADSDDILKIFGTETREIFYVAQENIEPLSETDFKLIRNRLVGDYYKGYDPLSGEYIPKEKYLFMFPDPHSNRTHSDSSHDQDKEKGKDSYSEVRARQQKETEELLVGIHGAFRDPLVLSHEAAKLSSVNSLPSNDFLRRFGGFFHSSKISTHSLPYPLAHILPLSFLPLSASVPPMSIPDLLLTARPPSLPTDLTTVPPSANSTSLPPSFSPPVSSSSSSSSPVSSIPLLSNSSLVYLLQTCATRAESETLTHIFWNLWMSSPSIDASRGLREGLNHLSRNNTNKARTYFQNALIHDPSLTEAYNKMATFESMEKHPVTCLKYSLQALQLIPSHYSAHAMTGISLLSMTKSTNSVRYQDALRSLTESLEFNPWSGWLATKLILLRTTSGRKIESVVKRRGTSSGGGGGGGGGSVRLVSSSEPKAATRQQEEKKEKTTGDDGITEEQNGSVTRTVASNSRTMQKKKGSLIEFDLIPESTEAEEEEEAEGEAEDEKKEGSKSKSEEGDQKKSEGEDDRNDSDKKTE